MEINRRLTIYYSPNFIQERKYIFSYFFEERFGLNIELIEFEHLHDYIKIILPNGVEIKVVDCFFNNNIKKWLKGESLPGMPLYILNLSDSVFSKIIQEKEIPVIFGLKKNELLDDECFLTIDVFGSAFFLLTGYEEYIITEKNEFGNFPFERSVCKSWNFVKRPIVDEYVELFWGAIKQLCPNIERRKENYRFFPTHDIDCPFLFYDNNLFQHIKGSFGDIIKRLNPKQFIMRNQSYFFKGKKDPYNTFDWLMDANEKNGLQSLFYFKNSRTASITDHPYSINTPALRKVLKNIDTRGHLIGFHPSTESFNNEHLFEKEINSFRKQCSFLGVKQEINCVRQHYLKYEIPTTSLIQEKSCFLKDSTLGFYNMTGFRRGTSHSFKIFDILSKRALQIEEYPLIVMDGTLQIESNSKNYCIENAVELLKICKRYNGNFVLLWHNQNLTRFEDKTNYLNLISLA